MAQQEPSYWLMTAHRAKWGQLLGQSLLDLLLIVKLQVKASCPKIGKKLLVDIKTIYALRANNHAFQFLCSRRPIKWSRSNISAWIGNYLYWDCVYSGITSLTNPEREKGIIMRYLLLPLLTTSTTCCACLAYGCKCWVEPRAKNGNLCSI